MKWIEFVETFVNFTLDFDLNMDLFSSRAQSLKSHVCSIAHGWNLGQLEVLVYSITHAKSMTHHSIKHE